MLIETEELEQVKDTFSQEFISFGGNLPIDDTVILDEYDEVDGPKAYELFLEGFNSQLSSESYDFNECLATFYSNELSQLDQYLQGIDQEFHSGPGENLVQNMKSINSLFLQADEGCAQILYGDKVMKMNDILDTFEVEYTAADRESGERLPKIRLVTDDASVDITD